MAVSVWEALAVLLIAAGLWQGTNQLQTLSQQLDQGLARAKRVALEREAQGRSAAGLIDRALGVWRLTESSLNHFFIGYQRRIVCLRRCADLPNALYAVETRVRVRPEYRARLAEWLRAHAWQRQSTTEWQSLNPIVSKAVNQRYAPLQQDDSLQRLLHLAS
jgi:hypothetical protein